MKTLFIPAKSKYNFPLKNIPPLPNKIALVYSIQFQEQAKKIKELLSKKLEITFFSQVLGCSKPNLSKDTQAIILVGQGRFHAIGLAIENNLPVYIIEQGSFSKIAESEIQKIKQKQMSSFKKFLSSKTLGILVSTKPGQENLRKALEFKKKLKNKNSYLYIANELNISEFENFPQIESWINTACPRMDLNSNNIINLDNLKNI